MPAASFPSDDSLCESCGYRLTGVTSDACPECGEPVADSAPQRRSGLPWQRSMGVASYVRTVAAVTGRPGPAFRGMSVDGPSLNARLFLLLNALLCGVVWLVVDLAIAGRHAFWAWAVAMAAIKSVIVLTYIEVLGLAFFSRRRGWRVSLGVAERLGCYASIGWVPAVAVLAAVSSLLQGDAWRDALARLPGGGVSPARVNFGVLVATAAVAMLWFEWLSWLGARKVRYANPR